MNPQEQTKIILPPNIRLASLPLATLSAQQDDELPPITFTRTPAGLYCGCSFSSPEIPQSLGENPDTTCPELEALSDKPEHRLEIETPVRFSSRLTLSWQQYQAVEAALDAILSRADHSVGVCLIASHVWLGMLRRMLSVAAAGAGEGYPADTSSRERGLSPARAEAFDYYLQSTTRENFAKAFQVASKPGHHQTVRRMLLGAIMSFRRSLRPGMGRIEAMGRVAFHNLRHWTRLGRLRFDLWGYKLSYGELDARSGDLDGEDQQRLLRHSFRHALFRKDLVLHTDVFRGVCYLVMVHGLIAWHTAALRHKEDRADVGKALAAVEALYVRNRAFNASYLYHPVLGDIFSHAFKQPAFAHRIINA